MKRLACCLFVIAAPAFAQNCAEPEAQTDMNLCAGQDFAKADAALNAAYKTLMAKISPAGQASLRRAEQAWLGYRDAQCAFDTLGTAGGSVRPMLDLQCKTALTAAQTKILAAQSGCQEGDLSCGGQ